MRAIQDVREREAGATLLPLWWEELRLEWEEVGPVHQAPGEEGTALHGLRWETGGRGPSRERSPESGRGMPPGRLWTKVGKVTFIKVFE